MVTVFYYADPEKITNSHIGNYFDMIEYCNKVFSSEGEAIVFLNECTRPLTSLSEIFTKNSSLTEADNILKHKRLGYYNMFDDVSINN